MKDSIQTKLFAMCIVLILLTTFSISATYFFLTKQDKHRESRQRIQIAFDIILNDILTRLDDSKSQLIEFINEDYTLNGVARLYNDDPDQIGTANFIRYQASRVPTELVKIGRMISASQMSVYGLDNRLLAVYRQIDGQETVGMYVASPEGKGTYLALDDNEKVFSVMSGMVFRTTASLPLPPGVMPYYENESPNEISSEFLCKGQRLGFTIRVPLRQLDQKIGLLVGEVFYTQEMAEKYASLSKTAVNLFAGTLFSVGTLREQSLLKPETLTQMAACEDIFSRFQAPTWEREKELTITSALFNNQKYYQGSCAFRNSRGNAGGITVSLSQDIEKQEIRKLVMAVLMISTVVIAVAFGLTAVFSRKTIRFIQNLTESTSAIAGGNLDQQIDINAGDELGTLARSFAHMRDSVKEKIADLSRLTTIMETTSDLVSMALPNAQIIYMNNAGRKMVGWKDDEDIAAKKISDIHPAWALEIIERKGIPEAVDKGGWHGETALLGDDSSEIPVSQVIMAHKSPNGELEYLSTIMRDITERLRAEKAESKAKLLAQEMGLARKIQTSLLPTLIENIHPDFEIAAFMLPADQVGGDFYDIALDRTGNLWLAIGDVSGHGVTPGLIMMMAQTVHTTVTANLDCDARDVVVKVNEILYMNVHDRLKESHFMTFTALKYLGSGQFQHAGAHLSMIVFRKKTGNCELIRTRGIYLNFKQNISKATKNSEFSLSPGDLLVLYTDGLTEAHNPDGKMLDLDGFVKIVESHAHQKSEAMKDAIMADVIRWCDNKRDDDMTLVVIKRKDA